ncbi:MAG: sugar ABC transporter permease [Armatimonadota bacterium]|nr:sugar ABC transporter permease [Armatimonadota bacterium]MDR7458322.1 sugar ABC transporter permease [Armatimonadota bacterium]MDR7478375.1 sugar ABC transporter permease [Armatimonadota bacterium]MDR7487309.1 sugar ABC transporter permease [Armatimonadota bacterium]MDR7490898.1 sugar ABC transporter permease [Armatimonadota bacterium]
MTRAQAAGWALRRPRSWEATGRGPLGYLYAIPALVVLLVFTYWPVLRTVELSLFRWNLIAPTRTYLGLENYRDLARSAEFWGAVWTTLKYFGAVLPLAAGVPLAVAVCLLALSRRLQPVLKLALFSPSVVSFAVGSMVWLWILNPIHGVANRALALAGLPGRSWLSDPDWALWAIVVLMAWKSFGYNLVIYLAGLAAIPAEYLDAAAADGASAWQTFRHVVWPLLSPTTLFVGLSTLIATAQHTFTPIQILTAGGPNRSTTNLVYLIYDYGFQFFQTGLASAVAVVMFVAFLGATWAQFRLLERFVHYEG